MNSEKKKARYGAWPSAITSDLIVEGSIGLSAPNIHQGQRYWTENRPQEGGRSVLVHGTDNGSERDVISRPENMRTRVHEYGGAASVMFDNNLYFSNFEDQQIYKQTLSDQSNFGKGARQLTNSPHQRFANGCPDKNHNRIIYVIEDHVHTEIEAKNFLGAVDIESGEITFLSEGYDFYAAPTLSPDGKQLAWITWQHPNMPWDETELWLGEISDKGELLNQRCICKAENVSIQQPLFSPDNQLYFISDESGWWNIHRFEDETFSSYTNIYQKEAEFGVPHWIFGQNTYLFTKESEVICTFGINNQLQLARINLNTMALETIETPYSQISGLGFDESGKLSYLGSSSTQFPTMVEQDLETGKIVELKSTSEMTLDKDSLSIPSPISFPSGKYSDDIAHAFFYPPKSDKFYSDDELPPLVVMLHGGPTGATMDTLSLAKQFWTSRGIAVLDLNYRGSTGYGRTYRDKLRGNWGITDVEDCVAACNYLVDQGLVDKDRLAIRGGSAGGYTTLCALTFTNTFKAGASHYGVSDLEALAVDTHKFESRYLDSVVGPYPEGKEIYQARSPINHVDKLSSACIFFQGLEDKVVPPNQAETMVDALDKKGLAVAYVPFEGEQHGFRRAENIKRALDLELYFYARIFGFTSADQIEPIKIMNLD